MNRQQRRAQGKNPRACHELIAATAMAIAGEAYEVLAGGNNDWYKANPNHKVWVMRKWSSFIQIARDHLVDLLADPNTPEAHKNAIFEALQNDGGLNPPVIHAMQANNVAPSLH